MKPPDSEYHPVSPVRVLKEIAAAIPADCREHMIIIGSLAVGYRYFRGHDEMVVRTKDADCLLSPRVAAISSGKAITERLMDDGWEFRKSDDWPQPGNSGTPTEELPVVRLYPPGRTDWFIELLVVPETFAERERRFVRLSTSHGDFALPSFGFLHLANFQPIATESGIYIALPEMMALANLLEHPEISSDTMSNWPEMKRSNKDLGRVVAIAWLAMAEDERALFAWPGTWKMALQNRFPEEWQRLAGHAGRGVRALLDSPSDLAQAHQTCILGLLASRQPQIEAFRIAAERLLFDAVEPLEAF